MRRLLSLALQELSFYEQRACCQTTCTRALHVTLLQHNEASPFLSLLQESEEINTSSSSSTFSELSSKLQTHVNSLSLANTIEEQIESSSKYNTETSHNAMDQDVQSVVDELVTRPLRQSKTLNTTHSFEGCVNECSSNDKNTEGANSENNTSSSNKDLGKSKLSTSTRYDKHEVPTASYKTFSQTDASDLYKVFISDRFGMPAELPRGAPQSFEELAELCPKNMKDELQTLLSIRNWSKLTSVQRAVIPFILEYRDVLCVSPTATGKTFAYVFPTMLRLALDAAQGQNAPTWNAHLNNNLTSENSSRNSSNLNGKDVEALIQDKINRGEICRYCELNLRESRLCPMTGVPHPPPPPPILSSSNNNKEIIESLQVADLRKPMWLHELNTVAAPRVLVLTPTSPLVHQTFRLFMALRGEFNIRYLLRAKTAEEQELYLRALRNPDVLISTPETILTPLLKRKLTLRQVKTVILDEVDLLVSSSHFEAIKMILSNLPKASNRAQRLCFAASLPVKAYEAIRDNMLLTSHRFILADANIRHSVLYQQPQLTQTQQQEQLHESSLPQTERSLVPSSTAIVRHLQTSASQLTHVVYMLGRAEKISKLVWMFKSGLLTPNQRVLIFCNSRHNVAYVYERLRSEVRQVHFTTLTSLAGQQARVGVLKMFTSGVSTCLICTDMLSRGVDLREVIYVVNYDTPTEMDT